MVLALAELGLAQTQSVITANSIKNLMLPTQAQEFYCVISDLKLFYQRTNLSEF